MRRGDRLVHSSKQLIDDDGVMFLTTRRNIESEQVKPFDYDFEKVTKRWLGAGSMVVWQLPLSADHDVEVVQTSALAKTARPVALHIQSADDAVLLSWAQLTSMLDGGVFEVRAGLVDTFPLESGWWDVSIGEPAVVPGDWEGSIRLRTTITIARRTSPPTTAELSSQEIAMRGSALEEL